MPRWLKEKGANLIIAGGMGMRAQNIFVQNGIEVITGAPMKAPSELIKDYLEEKLETGENTCDH